MADFGLRLWTGGVLQFDSLLATGGVCLGFVSVPAVGGVYNYPDITNASGGRVTASGLFSMNLACTISVSPSLTFNFPAGGVRSVALFAV